MKRSQCQFDLTAFSKGNIETVLYFRKGEIMKKSFFISGILILLISVISSNSFGDINGLHWPGRDVSFPLPLILRPRTPSMRLLGMMVEGRNPNPQTPDTSCG